MRVLVIASLLQILAAVLAVAVARRRAEHKAFAAFLAVAALANLGLVGFIAIGAPTVIPAAPLTGFARVEGHVRQALYMVWPFGLAAMFVAVFSKRRPWILAAAYGATLAVLVLGYPTIRGEVLRQVYFGTELAAIVISAGALIPWTWRRESPSLTHTAAILLLAGEVAVFLGPWRRDIFAGWDMGRVMYAVIYLVIAILQGGVLWKPSRSS
jgi:hypothetical protein